MTCRFCDSRHLQAVVFRDSVVTGDGWLHSEAQMIRCLDCGRFFDASAEGSDLLNIKIKSPNSNACIA